MNYEEEICELKRLVAILTAEIEALKPSMRHAHVMIDTFEKGILDVADIAVYAHEKVDSLLSQNPETASDIEAMEKIVGPFGEPTFNAPPRS